MSSFACDDVLGVISKFSMEPHMIMYLKQENKEKLINNLDLGWNFFYRNRHKIAEKASDDFIWEYREEVDWEIIMLYRKNITKNFVARFKDHLDWSTFCRNFRDQFDYDFIEDYEDYVDWKYISKKPELSMEFIDKYMDKLDLFILLQEQKLPVEFVYHFKDDFIKAEENAFDNAYRRIYAGYDVYDNRIVLVSDYLEREEVNIERIEEEKYEEPQQPQPNQIIYLENILTENQLEHCQKNNYFDLLYEIEGRFVSEWFKSSKHNLGKNITVEYRPIKNGMKIIRSEWEDDNNYEIVTIIEETKSGVKINKSAGFVN